MKMEGNISIFDSDEDNKTTKMYEVAINALKAMTNKLVLMENNGETERAMIMKCVWPILTEADKKFTLVKMGNDVNVSDFDSVIKK